MRTLSHLGDLVPEIKGSIEVNGTQVALLTWLVFLILGPPALAEPSNAIIKLMDQPVSYFDYGLGQLNRQVEDIAREHVYSDGLVKGLYVGGAQYDWNRSQITIVLSRLTNLGEDPHLFEEECKGAIDTVRSKGAMDFSVGKVMQPLPYSPFAALFLPKSYEVQNLPSDVIGKELDASLFIRITITNPEKTKRLICSGQFLGTGYEVQK